MDEQAIQAEANGDTTLTVEWRGQKFTLPRDRGEWPYEAVLAFEEGKSFVAVRELLAEDDFAAFLAEKPKAKDAGELIDLIARGLGAEDAGE